MRRTALLIASLMIAVPIGAAETPSSLFPVAPAVNTQRGFAVALDGSWLAVGAPQEEIPQEGEASQEEEAAEEEAEGTQSAGVVRLYRFEGGLWIEKQRLASPEPKAKGRFGHSVALSGSVLAVGAAGEGKVYIYTRNEEEDDEDEWFLQATVQDEKKVERFGQSVALDGTWLAIGAVDPNGRSGPGSVHLLNRVAGEWSKLPPLQGNLAAPDERFGASVSLKRDILAVGAPGADESKGAVYVFQAGGADWERVARRTVTDGGAGDQLGFAVSVNANGTEIAAGAPTADAPGAVNQGALYLFEKGEGWNDGAVGRLSVPGIDGGDHLGHSVSIYGNLLAAGAPFGSPRRSGAVHVLIQDEFDAWNSVDPVEAGNAELLDLFGYSVAVESGRVAVGTVLLEQGGSSAGSAHTFKCNGSGCTEEGEAAANDQQVGTYFGAALDLDGDTLVVSVHDLEGSQGGAVYVFRRAGEAWRQEAKLVSPTNAKYFGVAVAVRGNALVVGDPTSSMAYLFHRMADEWIPRATLTSPTPRTGDLFGLSVAIDGETVVIGAPGFSTAYVFEGGAAPGIPLLSPFGFDHAFGVSVAVSGDTAAVGAPNDDSVHLFRKTKGWAWETRLTGGQLGSWFGSTLSMDQGSLLVGAPSDEDEFGTAFLYERGRSGWTLRQTLSEDGLQFFGLALDFHDGAAIAVGYRPFQESTYSPAIRLYTGTKGQGLTAQAEVELNLDPTFLDTSVAVGSDFFAVGVPKSGPGDRVLIFERTASEEVQP